MRKLSTTELTASRDFESAKSPRLLFVGQTAVYKNVSFSRIDHALLVSRSSPDDRVSAQNEIECREGLGGLLRDDYRRSA